MRNTVPRLFLVIPVLLAGLVSAQVAAVAAAPSRLTASSTSKSNPRINVNFQSVDRSGLATLKYGTILMKTQLAGITLKSGASGVLGMLLPEGIRLQAEIVRKGKVPIVILWKGTTNLNIELLVNGVAQASR